MVMVCQDSTTRINPKTGLIKRGFFLDDALKENFDRWLIPAVRAHWDGIILITGIEGCFFLDTDIQIVENNCIGIRSTAKIPLGPIKIRAFDFANNKPVDADGILVDSGLKELFLVKTADGRQVKVSADHVFFVKRDNKIVELPLKELKPGDKIFFQRDLTRWTAEDFEFLKANYAAIGLKECAKALNKSPRAVKNKACDLKLKYTGDMQSRMVILGKEKNSKMFSVKHYKVNAHNDKALPMIKELIRTNYEKASIEDLEKMTGISYTKIKKIACKMGLSRDFIIARPGLMKLDLENNPAKWPESRKKMSLSMMNVDRSFALKFSKAEQEFKLILDRNNIKYKYNSPIRTLEHTRFPDFEITDKNILIEIDGSYKLNNSYQLKRHQDLEQLGYKILRFYNKQILNDPLEVEKCLLQQLNQ